MRARKTNLRANDAQAFLHAHGINVAPSGLDRMVALAVAQLPRTLQDTQTAGELTEAEVKALRRGGFVLEPKIRPEDDPLALTAAEYAAILKTSRTAAQAAKALGVNESRIRQRLTSKPPTLYGIKVDSEWRIPAFVFDGKALLTGIDKVVPRLDTELHPVAFARWLSLPNPDLLARGLGEKPLSPRDWLRLGFSPDAVAQLAADL